ncbi:site-specific integrase [Halomonas sp. QX-2]|uniref:Site-specific integrase n=1 Tax=Vreelandella sedimenti TaxID=2729618 RepID=A0A7Z0NA68_9GAMM|nr:site-specific integrase [Halomonas sedimenti]NYT73756.1 site-specific integrase [Halomonas sedimenti]
MSDQPLWSGWRLPRPQKMSSDGQEKRRYQRDRERYQFLMGILETLEQKVPGVMEGKPNLSFSDADTSAVFEALHQNTPPKALRKTHNFLVRGLENGHEKLKWRVMIPSPLVTVVRKPPTVTTSSFSDLHRWDALVEKHDAMSGVENLSGNALSKWMVGRWLFQLIREGALLNKRYLEQMPQAFEQGTSFASGTGFLTLADCIQSTNAGEEEKEQDEASVNNLSSKSPSETPIEKELRFHYRRLCLSPMSQLLLLNTYQDIGNAWPRSASKSIVPVEQCLMFYIKHIAVETPPASMSALLTMAKTASALDMPPLLTHYASKADSSLSLRPSSWQRLFHRNVLTATSVETHDEDVYLDFQTTHQTSTTPSDQLKQLRQLQQCFSPSMVGQTGRRKAIDNINAFLAVSNSNGVIVTMLANWCKKLMQKGGRVKSKLVASTAETYLSTIARPLVAHSQTFGDVRAASADQWEALYEDVLNSAKTSSSRAKMRNRLYEFHHFLVDSYALPHIDLDSANAEKQRVDVNIITPAEFRRALALIDTSQQPERFRTMQKLSLILGYRLGIRRSECAGLQIKDVTYLFDNDAFDGEIIIRSNDYRKGKSYSATRRLPLWLLMPEERKDLIDWVKRRKGEITTQQVTKQLLFCRSGTGRLLLEDKVLFKPIQTALKTVSGDHTLRYHHLRHSFVTFTLLRLLERMPGELLPDAWVLDDQRNIAMPNTDADISALAGLAPQDRPSRKRLWQLALWAGHASPDETLSSYTHSLDWILGQALRERFNPTLNIDQQFALLNFPTKTALSSWRNRRGLKGQTQAGVLLQYLQDEWQPYLADDPLEQEWQPYQPPTENPLDNPLEASFDWPEATTIYQSLRLVEQQEMHGIPFGDAIHQTASRFVLDPGQLSLWLEHGEALMQRKTRKTNQQFSREDNRNDRSRRVASQRIYMPELQRCMAPPIKPEVLREAGHFFHRLLDWHQSQPDIAEESLMTLRNHMQRSTGQIELPSVEAINSVRELLRPLRCYQHVYLVVEVEMAAKEKSIKRYWSNSTDIPHERIELIPTPSPSGRTRHWHGNANLKITRGNYKDRHQPLWEALRFAAFMTMLVLGLGVDEQLSVSSSLINGGKENVGN